MTIFRESDKRVYSRKVSERNQYYWGHLEKDDETEIAYQYANIVRNIKQRLEIMGFTLNRVKNEFDLLKKQKIEGLHSNLEEAIKDLEAIWEEELRLLESSSFDDFLSSFKEIIDRKLFLSSRLSDNEKPLIRYIIGNEGAFYHNFPCYDFRSFLRAVLEVSPEESLVVQDITELVNAGYYDPDDEVCELAIEELLGDPISEKIIILTEGSTDKNVLEKSLKLLYPHLVGYYSFMDFGIANASGGASCLVSTIKSFVGSGIGNRIIALFDNDTAAKVAIKGLKKTIIPQNIKIFNYPDIEVAKNYPTLGPSGISKLNINGLACSIELYFGNDVLAQPDGQLIPIQWKGYDESINQYQGELLRKQDLQNAFFEKLDRCFNNNNLLEQADWSGMKLILEVIFKAFQE